MSNFLRPTLSISNTEKKVATICVAPMIMAAFFSSGNPTLSKMVSRLKSVELMPL
jgi:cell division protein FtsX